MKSATIAGILWALKSVQSGYSSSSCNDIANNLKAMCPDSQIVKDFKVAHLKLIYIVNYGIASYLSNFSMENLKKHPVF